MNRRIASLVLLLAATAISSAPREARAQGVSLDLSAGQIVYEPASVNLGANTLFGTLRYDARREAWVYGSAAIPLSGGDTFWGALGAGGRFLLPDSDVRHATLGIDLGAEGFRFRDAVAEQSGTGGTLQAMPLVRILDGAARLELRGGVRGYALDYQALTKRRGVLEGDARISYGAAVRVQGNARLVRAAEGTFPFVGGQLAYGGPRVNVWAQAGRWVSNQLDDVAWGVGADVALGPSARVWISARQEAPDPLYWNPSHRTWSAGVTQRLGRARAAVLAPPRTQDGSVLIRVPLAEAPGTELSIAGDFSQWQPQPMTRQDAAWVIRLPLAAGVYNYAFRSSTGRWFVPASTAGRHNDGMGGEVAVLVVQ